MGLPLSEIDCTFIPPEGLCFVGWTLEEGSEEIITEEIWQDVTLYPVWQKVYDVYIGDTGMENGTYLGTDGTVSTQKPEGGYARYSEGTLTLHNFTYNGEYCKVLQAISQIYATKDVTLLLEGENVLVDLDGTGSAIRADNASITVCGEGSLKVIAEQGFTVENGTLTVAHVRYC